MNTRLFQSGSRLLFTTKQQRILFRSFSASSKMASVTTVTTPSDVEKALQSGKPTVIDFTATWCGPCKMIGPIFHKLPQSFPNINFLSVDVDTNAAVASSYEVQAMPTFIFFDANGTESKRLTGANVRALQENLAVLNSAIKAESENVAA